MKICKCCGAIELSEQERSIHWVVYYNKEPLTTIEISIKTDIPRKITLLVLRRLEKLNILTPVGKKDKNIVWKDNGQKYTLKHREGKYIIHFHDNLLF